MKREIKIRCHVCGDDITLIKEGLFTPSNYHDTDGTPFGTCNMSPDKQHHSREEIAKSFNTFA